VEGLAERIGALLGARPVSWGRRAAPWQTSDAVEGGNERFSVLLDDGRRVFVKAAQAEHTAAWLRREHEVYSHLRGSFIPRLEAFDDDPVYPVLVLEDLSDADWDVHWDEARVALVRAALAELVRSDPPPSTQTVRETFPWLFGRWRVVEQDPEPFLSTGIRSRRWLDEALPTLIAAADAVPADGDDLLHLDVRSDNLCFREDAAILVDWNWCSTVTRISTSLPGCRASRSRAARSRGRFCRARGSSQPFSLVRGRPLWACRRPRPHRRCDHFSAASSRWRSRGASGSSVSRRQQRARR